MYDPNEAKKTFFRLFIDNSQEAILRSTLFITT